MIDDTDTDQENTLDISTLPPKQAAYALLRQTGLKTDEAAKALDYKQSSAYQINSKLNKYSLTNKKLVKSAHQVIKNILEAKPFGAVNKIKDTTTLQAAGMVYDRVEPAVKQSMNLNLNADISPVDYSEFDNKNR